MKVVKTKDGRYSAGLFPTCYSFYDGGCFSCGKGKGSPWESLPETLNYPEFHAIGFFCATCKKDFEVRPALRRAFALVLENCYMKAGEYKENA